MKKSVFTGSIAMSLLVLTLVVGLFCFRGGNYVHAAPSITQGISIIHGSYLSMSYGGPPWDHCHHYVHFSYSHSLNGHIGGFGVSGPGGVQAWGSPSNGQLNAGYHTIQVPVLECNRDTSNRASDFTLVLLTG